MRTRSSVSLIVLPVASIPLFFAVCGSFPLLPVLLYGPRASETSDGVEDTTVDKLVVDAVGETVVFTLVDLEGWTFVDVEE